MKGVIEMGKAIEYTQFFKGQLPQDFRLLLDEDCFYLFYKKELVKILYNLGTSVEEIERCAKSFLKDRGFNKF
ncbi:MAG: hypothetical protein ACPLXL_01280 [Minisyncoccia bacterium]